MPEKQKLRDMVYTGMFACLMSICAWISIPAPVPFTLQTLGVFLTMGLLGGKRGTRAVGLYLLMGCVGLPVFSGFQGGFGHLLGASGGYLIGFLGTALVMWGIEALASPRLLPLGMFLGTACCYLIGTGWYVRFYATGTIGFPEAFSLCVAPYLLPDLCKGLVALPLIRKLRPHLALSAQTRKN